MRKVLLLVLLGLFYQVSATRIRNKSGVAVSVLIRDDFSRAINYSPDLIELSPQQETAVSLPKTSVLTFIVVYRGSDPRYSGLRMEQSYPLWRWGIPGVVDIYLDPIVTYEKDFGSDPRRLYRFSISTPRHHKK